MQNEGDIYDVIVIGGGPAGLTAAQYASRAKLKTIVLDKSSTAGALAYSSKIENYPGLTKPVSGKELLNRMRQQAIKFGSEYIETQVVGVNLSGELKEVITIDKSYKGKALIIATGSMGRRPSVKGEGEFLGKGVSYCAICDAAFFKGKRVCVVGGSEEAIKEAEVLARFAEKVYLISPNTKMIEEFPAIKMSNIEVLSGYNVISIEGTDFVDKIRIVDRNKKEAEINLSGVFIYLYGNKPVVEFLLGSLKTGKDGCIEVNDMMETSIPGVFAAGDVTCTGIRQVVVATSQGCISALSAERYLYKREKLRMDWNK